MATHCGRYPGVSRSRDGPARIIADSLALASSTRLGPWEILSAIGAGGMGEVYRARVYAADEWTEVGKLASALAKDRPDNGVHLALDGAAAARIGDRALAMKPAAALAAMPSDVGGAVELRRKQRTALLGKREPAVAFRRNAFASGLGMTLALHRPTDFESLRGFTSFDDLMKPKG